MKKDLLKKIQLGMVSLSAIALLAACGNNNMDDPDSEDEPAGLVDPADEETEDEGTTGGVSEEEEEAN